MKDPGFVNPSGNRPEDFKRTSYAGDVVGSSYGTVAGAYKTGAECIGLLSGCGAPPPPDTSPPSVPAGLAATAISSSHITLSWTASTDNVGVTGYRLYRDGALIASPAGTTYNDAGLAAGTTYSYRVAAVDGAGNASGQSPAVAEATLDGGGGPTASSGGSGCGMIRSRPPSSGGTAAFLLTLFWPLALLTGRKLYRRCCSA